MTATFARKVATRTEITGSAQQDRAQLLAQQVGKAHEITKATVQALANTAYIALAVDTTIGATAYATLLTTTITSVLATSSLDITATLSGVKITAVGTVYVQVLVDGVIVKGAYTTSQAVPNTWNLSIVVRRAVTRGAHTVLVQWKTDTASVHVNPATVVEEHAALLVREAP